MKKSEADNYMISQFSTRVLRKYAEGRTSIVDGGCGTGANALYIAGHNPNSTVIGYDISPEAVQQAIQTKERHGINNAYFQVSDHDGFKAPRSKDMVYTSYSLIGEHEIPDLHRDQFSLMKDTIRKRFSNFSEMLTDGGVYVLVWGFSGLYDDKTVEIAADSGMLFVESKHHTVFIPEHGYECETALIFERR